MKLIRTPLLIYLSSKLKEKSVDTNSQKREHSLKPKRIISQVWTIRPRNMVKALIFLCLKDSHQANTALLSVTQIMKTQKMR